MAKVSDFSKAFQDRFNDYLSRKDPQKLPSANGILEYEEVKDYLRDYQSVNMWATPSSNGGQADNRVGEKPGDGVISATFDLRHLRPYYLIPLLEVADPGEHRLLRSEILAEAERRRKVKSPGGAVKPVTDIFVLSHGWHRNLFSGVAAYDRLLSRFFLLVHRERIQLDSTFSPIYLCCHWHSDPGKDGWVDNAGRRDKYSFLTLAKEIFRPVSGTGDGMQTDFEDLFEVMACISAPDVQVNNALVGMTPSQFTDRVQELTSKFIRQYGLNSASGTSREVTPDEKICHLWRCYAESDARGLLVDQYQEPMPVGSPATALAALVSFVLGTGVLGIALLPKIGTIVLDWIPVGVKVLVREKWLGLFTDINSRFLFGYKLNNTGFLAIQWLVGLVIAYVVSIFVLGIAAFWKAKLSAVGPWRRAAGNKSSSASGLPILPGFFWLIAQIVGTLPILCLLITTWIFRTAWVLFSVPFFLNLKPQFLPGAAPLYGCLIVLLCFGYATEMAALGKNVGGLYKERLKNIGDEPFNVRDYLAAVARLPINLLRIIIGTDSSLMKVAQAIDNQLGFFEYQRKGVDAGDDLGRFLTILLNQDAELASAKIHFIGHSFGGLVILNASRRLFVNFSHKVKLPSPKKKHIRERLAKRSLDEKSPTGDTFETPITSEQKHSMSLIQSATSSNWFSEENSLVRVFRTIGCIYSKYDTANGFYYPLSNNGRLPAGWVGLCQVPLSNPAPVVGHDGQLVMVVRPPDLPPPVVLPAVNLDSSRLISKGPVASGGGHDDIFKDDVVNIVWAITQRK